MFYLEFSITSEPEIAAYFATQKWINGQPTPIGDGVGCIRGFMPPFAPPEQQGRGIFSEKFHRIGLQCFQRPGLQFAYGLETTMGEDYAHQGWRVLFRQNIEASNRIYANFHYDYAQKCITANSCLFPKEEIAEVAKLVKRAVTVTQKAVEERCEQTGEIPNDIVDKLKAVGCRVVKQPVFELSADRILELTKEYAKSPYGNVSLTARLSCHP